MITSSLILDNEESPAVGSTEDIDYTPMPPESALFIFSSTNMWVWKKKDRVCLHAKNINSVSIVTTLESIEKTKPENGANTIVASRF